MVGEVICIRMVVGETATAGEVTGIYKEVVVVVPHMEEAAAVAQGMEGEEEVNCLVEVVMTKAVEEVNCSSKPAVAVSSAAVGVS